jgi:hypothetical protein
MPGGLLSEALAFAPNSAALFALLAMLPALCALYLHFSVGARKLRPTLSLGQLETIELERAVLLYEKVSKRRKEICQAREQLGPGWRARYRGLATFRKIFGKELEELESYGRDLRFTIIRLRGRPIRRYKFWIHVISSRFALGRSLGCYLLILALLIASFCYFEPPLWAPGTHTSFDTFVLWQALEGRLLLANWMAASLVVAAMPMLYLVRRAQLYRQHGHQILNLREFAAADPDRLIAQRQGDEEATEQSEEEAPEERGSSAEMVEESTWFGVLGVSQSATIEEVKQAYRVLVRQNHPDRVHDMSPALKELAEAETKKLNVAYAQALMYLRHDDLRAQEVDCAA